MAITWAPRDNHVRPQGQSRESPWAITWAQIMQMKRRDELSFLAESGALIIQAHPYREASYIDHIRLFPRNVHGVEIINANRNELENSMAAIYAKSYGLLDFAGTDNHLGGAQKCFAGMASDHPIKDEMDFLERVKNGEMTPFSFERE